MPNKIGKAVGDYFKKKKAKKKPRVTVSRIKEPKKRTRRDRMGTANDLYEPSIVKYYRDKKKKDSKKVDTRFTSGRAPRY